ncbi:helix-turn-helix transcriptional regulator [Sporanaerobacter sp. PP17-6a]|uniref:helix-turn-helix transcriptional regulator n=1 Tax=Sporanaerobacter sp. PP17-6a TaxID=1891289 RepID=UPI0008A0571A|nr:helix-turn-helix transcriptional regulator [Sporanaerobacter sp. PP17-6a]SCL84976.1 HTH-type transcriptional regulator ImmR [Sporanaerobacter sp. PP17-6a]
MINLKEIRIKKGLTQKELADAINLSQETISQYEIGNRTPSIVVARKIAEVLGVSLDNIFFGSDISK